MGLAGERGDGDLGKAGVQVAAGERRWGVAGKGLGDGVAGEAADSGDRAVAQPVGGDRGRPVQSRQVRARSKIVL